MVKDIEESQFNVFRDYKERVWFIFYFKIAKFGIVMILPGFLTHL